MTTPDYAAQAATGPSRRWPGDPTRKTLDPASLKALAHPLRADLFRALQEGPATSTQLAKRLGSNTGTVSWHLRQLERFGFIEDAPGHGSGRERWWRAGVAGTTLDIRDPGMLDPVALEAARWFVRDESRAHWEALHHWIDTAQQWSQDWIGASFLHDTVIELTPSELLALQQELLAAVERLRRRPWGEEPSARSVKVALQAFPTGAPDG
jgi:DNA-binding transcriptional ArsR family regulator